MMRRAISQLGGYGAFSIYIPDYDTERTLNAGYLCECWCLSGEKRSLPCGGASRGWGSSLPL